MQCLCVVLGHRCPMLPQMYRQKAVCEREGVVFQSKIDMMEATLGLGQYQLLSSTAIVRFWTLVIVAYVFLDEERARLRETQQTHITLGDARREVQRCHWRYLLDWIHQQFSSGVTPNELHPLLAA